MMPTIMKAAAPQQKGFISDRHFTDNILVLDSLSRIYSNQCSKFSNSTLAFFDFSNAFPSVCIQWIFRTLELLRVPVGIRRFIRCLYHQCNAYMKQGGLSMFMCIVKSGVLLGCPLASIIFILSIESFVQLF